MSAIEQSTQPPAREGSIHMVATLGGVAVLSGLLIVLAVQLTLPRILENKRLAIQRAVFEVVPGAESRTTFLVTPEGLRRLEDNETPPGVKIYAAYGADGSLAGAALEAAGQGYQDIIRILYGYNPGRQCITGMTVLESKETPGLGDRIGKDPDFLENFKALDARLNAEGTGLNHAIDTVKSGTKNQPWQIDGLTGATISSKAVGRMLNRNAAQMLPVVIEHLDELKAASP